MKFTISNIRSNTLIRLFLLVILCVSFNQQNYTLAQTNGELYRPEFHFTPAKNWMNDPNGLVYFKGEYHIFYQYNPLGNQWGNMSWGHAKSKDLIKWDHLPIAIPVIDNVMAFSGSVVVDWNNTTGFGINNEPALVAIYTGAGIYQDQRLAYSIDGGNVWKIYEQNPVLSLFNGNFRDPKVIWHEASKKWIMVVSLGEDKKIKFYKSTDLKTWEFMQDFGPIGDVSGAWECPDLFPLPIDDTDNVKWVLVNSIAPGSAQYFIGDFDGNKFTWANAEISGLIIEDFENGSYENWTVVGDAFGVSPASGTLSDQQSVAGYLGGRLINSFLDGDGTQGKLTSKEFTIQKANIGFLIGGGNHIKGTYIKLVVNGKVAASSTGLNAELLSWRNWNVQDLIGENAHIEIIDSVTGGWGHINVDHIIQTDAPIEAVNYGKVDYGKDFYAVQSFSDVSDGRRIWLAWMSNWSYSGEVPTSPWRGIMSIPRELALRTVNGQVKLTQEPINELSVISNEILSVENQSLHNVSSQIASLKLKTFELECLIDANSTKNVNINFKKANNQYSNLIVDVDHGELRFNRSQSGSLTRNQIFSDVQVAPLIIKNGEVQMRMIVDNCSVEIFHADGQIVLSNQIFPDSTSNAIEISSEGNAIFRNLSIGILERDENNTSLKENQKIGQVSLQLYPNPVDNELTISSSNFSEVGNLEIRIFNSLGREMTIDTNMQHNNSRYTIRLKNFPTGLYIVRLSDGIRMLNYSFIKK